MAELLTMVGRQRIKDALIRKTGKNEYLICDKGFLWDNMSFSDQEMIDICIDNAIDVAEALITPSMNEPKLII